MLVRDLEELSFVIFCHIGFFNVSVSNSELMDYVVPQFLKPEV